MAKKDGKFVRSSTIRYDTIRSIAHYFREAIGHIGTLCARKDALLSSANQWKSGDVRDLSRVDARKYDRKATHTRVVTCSYVRGETRTLRERKR